MTGTGRQAQQLRRPNPTLPPLDLAPRRILPAAGRTLALRDISGNWQACARDGMFGVRWGQPGRMRWAPLHAFSEDAQRTLISQCHRADIDANGPAVAGWGRAA